ncbi:hypothetical protein MMC27_005056 [Xylographa pallens]|nr:hypothetical protein [Xylographa pallens]
MAQQPSSERHAAVSAYWDLLNRQLSEEAARGNSNTLDITVESAIHATIGRCTFSLDPPELLDFDLHSFWRTIFLAAQNFHADNPKQDTLLRYILYVREYGTVIRKASTTGIEPVLARTSNGQRIWTDLPFLAEDLYEWRRKEWTNMSTIQRGNISSFIARLVSVGVCGNALSGCALLNFREALETPSRSSASNSGHEPSIQDLMGPLCSWLVYAGHKLTSLVSKSFNEFEDMEISSLGELALQAGVSEPGFNPRRWAFWKQRLVEIHKTGAVDGVSDVLKMMEDMDEEGNMTL